MISKELLREVIGFCPDAIEECKDGSSLDLYELSPEDGSVIGGGNINIHELAHKCKEWAFKQGYELFVSLQGNNIGSPSYYCYMIDIEWRFPLNGNQKYEREYSEPEAIFKACQWIMEND